MGGINIFADTFTISRSFNMFNKFADDTNVFRKIKSDADRQHLQDDLNKLIEWSEKWQMLFNFGKCKCLHTGHGNEDAQYTMGGTILNTTLKEKDLGLTVSADMKVSEQCGIATAKRETKFLD